MTAISLQVIIEKFNIKILRLDIESLKGCNCLILQFNLYCKDGDYFLFMTNKLSQSTRKRRYQFKKENNN